MMLTFKDLTVEERVPVYLNAFESVVVSAAMDINPKMLHEPGVVSKVVAAAWAFLPRTDINWLYKYCDSTMLRKSFLYLESISDNTEERPTRTLVDTHSYPIQEEEVALSIWQMKARDIESLLLSVMFQTVYEMYNMANGSGTLSCDPVETAHNVLMNVMSAFVPDADSFDLVKFSYIADEGSLSRVARFISMNSESDETLM